MKIIENKAVLLQLKNPNRVTEVIPKSKVIAEPQPGKYSVLVNWGPEEVQVLHNLGFTKVPPPIKGRYNWPGMYKPMAHQIETAAFFTLRRKCFCLNEQGTGKTLSAAWACDYLMERKIIKRVLVICPLSIMKAAWQADLFRSLMHRRVDIAHGDRLKRKQVVQSDAEFVIINYDGVEIVQKEILEGGFDLVICDEASFLKNSRTKRYKAIQKIIKPDTWLWLMTGTPAAQSPLDAYGLAKLVRPSSVPQYFGGWRDMVMTKITQFKYAPRKDAKDKVFQVLQPAIRFTKEECLDLPEILYTTRDVPLTTQQERYYKELKKEMMIVAAGEGISSANAATNLNKLLQISGGAVYTDNGETVEFDVSNRLNELLDVITESSHKVLVFVPFRHTIDLIEEFLTAQKVTCGTIHGGISANNRADLFNKFQLENDPRVLIIQPQAASHGVTLHAANTIVWWSPITSYETYAQANARVHRKGQRNQCLVVRLQGSPVEEKLYKALASREDSLTSLLGLYKEELEV